MEFTNGQRWMWLAVLVVCFAVAPSAHAQKWWRKGVLEAHQGFKVRLYTKAQYARSMTSVVYKGATILYVGTRKDWGGAHSDVFAVVDSNSDGVVDYVHSLVVDGINTPHGIALQGDSLFVASYEDFPDDGVKEKGLIWRLDNVHQYALQNKTYKRNDADLKVITDALPGDRWHGWRYIKFDSKDQLLVTIGIPCNACEVDDPAAPAGDGGTGKFRYGTIYRLNVANPNAAPVVVATGVRNSVGLEHHPDTKELYFTDNGRDDMGPNRPDCELNKVTQDGQDFGSPYCHTQGFGAPMRRSVGRSQPINNETLAIGGPVQNCTKEVAEGRRVAPVQAMGPHVAPLGLRFYRWSKDAKAAFPKEWDRTLFIVQRGSWNREPQPIGQRIMSLRLNATGAPSDYRKFVSGWLKQNATSKGAAAGDDSWGRPADLEQLPDGSLLISDDTSSSIFRVTWEGKRR